MLGAIYGDKAGSIYEFSQTKKIEPVMPHKLILPNSFYSDDTIETVAIIDAIMADSTASDASTINDLWYAEANNTVSFNNSLVRALVGDFQNMFKWGYAKEMYMDVIEYGNPDNDADLGDLKGHNQVYVRVEAYLGWGILDKDAFAFVKAAEQSA